MLFRKEIDPMCGYCRHSKKLGERALLTCKNRGIILPTDSCRFFSYDALKRIPSKPAKLITRGLTDDDFKLDE